MHGLFLNLSIPDNYAERFSATCTLDKALSSDDVDLAKSNSSAFFSLSSALFIAAFALSTSMSSAFSALSARIITLSALTSA